MSDPAIAAQNAAAANLARIRQLDMAKAAAAKAEAAAKAGSPATAGSAQANAGAEQVQAGAQAAPQAEAFNAPMLKLGANPTMRGTVGALAVAMGDPSVNESSAQILKGFHDQIFEMYKENVSQWTIRRVS